MAITKTKKEEIISEIRDSASRQLALFFINFKGMKATGAEMIRKELRENESKMIVAKKTLVGIAFEKEGINFNPLEIEEEAAFVFSFEDIAKTAKILSKFEKEEMLSIVGGLCEGEFLTTEEARAIANLPSREELLAKTLGTVSAPMTGFLSVLEGNIRGLVNVLNKSKV